MTECKGDGDCFNVCKYENHSGHKWCKNAECLYDCVLIKCISDHCNVMQPKHILDRYDGQCMDCFVDDFNNILK